MPLLSSVNAAIRAVQLSFKLSLSMLVNANVSRHGNSSENIVYLLHFFHSIFVTSTSIVTSKSLLMDVTSPLNSEYIRFVSGIICLSAVVAAILAGVCYFAFRWRSQEQPEDTSDISEVPTNVYDKRQGIFEDPADESLPKEKNLVHWVSYFK